MSTIQQVTKQFPPTYLSVGDGDPFYSQNESFIRKLKSKHVPTTTLFTMVHIILSSISISFRKAGI